MAVSSIDFTYLAQPPKRYTFEQPKLLGWVEQWAKPKVLNLFAGKVRLGVEEVRVDISDEFSPDFVGDAYDFLSAVKDWSEYGTVLLDPPYNIRKAREKYEGRFIGKLTKCKNVIGDGVLPGTRVISLGYDTVGMSKSRGFKKVAICVVCHGGDHNDTLCLVEEKL